MMTSRTRDFFVMLGIIALFGAADSHAAAVKDIIVNAVDPGHSNGTVVRWFDELTPEQQAAFDSNFNAGQGYFITPTAKVMWIEDGIQYTNTTMIFIVPVNGGQTVVPMAITCNHTGCHSECATVGCLGEKGLDGKPQCSGASCKKGMEVCQQNPSCTMSSTMTSSAFLVFGTI